MAGVQCGNGQSASDGRCARLVGAALILAAASVLIAGFSSPALAASQRRPNVIVIETDDQTAEQLKVMQNVKAEIEDQGTTFSNSFVNLSSCCPSRATFLTGEYAHNHHIVSNKPPGGGFTRFQKLHSRNNLAVWLRRAGYHTALVGKYLNGFGHALKSDVPRGWTQWYSTMGPTTQKVYDYNLDQNGRVVHYGHKIDDYKQDVFTRKAVGFVRDATPSRRPFFLWLTYTAPHTGGPNPSPQPPSDCVGSPKPAPRHAHTFDSEPLPKPPSFDEADVSDKPQQVRKLPRLSPAVINHLTHRYRCELESLQSVDEGVAAVIRQVRSLGELERTYVIFTSDNGLMHGEHRITGGKGEAYEEAIRVPLAIRGPAIPAGGTSSQLVINADLAPTIARIAHARPRLKMDGRPLLRFARHPERVVPRALLVENDHYRQRLFPATFKGVRTRRYLYVRYRIGQKELYDLKKDPYELKNVHGAPRYHRVERRLRQTLHELRNCSGRGCRIPPRGSLR